MRPAESCGVAVEPALVQRLLNDSDEDPDKLPVLQHLLKRLWEQRGVDGLDVPAYDRVGGWRMALERDAEEVLSQFPDELEGIGRLFQWLSETGPGGKAIRRRRSIESFPLVTGLPRHRLRDVIAAFTGRDLLRSGIDLDGRVEFIHESVLWQWPRLKFWIEQESLDADRVRFVNDAAHRKVPLTGSALEEARELRTRILNFPLWAMRYLEARERVECRRSSENVVF